MMAPKDTIAKTVCTVASKLTSDPVNGNTVAVGQTPQGWNQKDMLQKVVEINRANELYDTRRVASTQSSQQ